MAKTSKLTKDNPSASVTYPDDVAGPVTIKVTGGEEEFTKKITFDGGSGDGGDGGSGDGGSGGDEGGGEQPTGDIEATVEQDQKDPRKVTVTVTKTPEDSGSGSGDGGSGSGEPSNGSAGSEGGTQGTGASTADQTSPKARAGETDGGSGSGSSGESKPLTIEWGGKTKGEAPTEIEKDKPVTVTYDPSVEKATITIDDDDEATEPFTKGLKFGAPPEPDGDIVVKATQDAANPRKVTFELQKAPGQDGGSGGESGSGESGSGDQSGSQQGGQQA